MSHLFASTAFAVLMRVLALALAYVTTGWLSLLLAIPPGFVSGIFLPLGIALAAMLIWGNYLVIGVIIGSTLLNIGVSLNAGQALSVGVAQVAFFIACGSGIACWIGAWLIRRFVGFPNFLTDERDIFLLFMLGGPVAACVSASMGTLVLFTHQVILAKQLLFTWATWWVGDALGVLISLPLMCVFFAQPRYFWRNRRATVGLPMLCSSLTVVVIFIIASNNEQKKTEVQFKQEASLVSVAVQASLLSIEQVLATLGGLFVASEDVTPQEFSAYVARIISKKEGISGFSWNQVVLASERDSYEQEMRELGYENFSIREIKEGALIEAPLREKYVVITYIEPWEEGRLIHGMNASADAQRYEAIVRADASGQFALTRPLQLFQDSKFTPAVIAFYPVYSLAHLISDQHLDGTALLGYATAIVRNNDLIGATLKPFTSADYNLLVTDVTDPADPIIFFTQEQAIAPAYAQKLILLDQIIIGGRSLQIRIAPTEEFLAGKQGLQSWFVLVGGLMFCSLLGGFLLLISGRTQHIHNLVDQRTQELATILDNATEAILVVDGSGSIEKANPAAAALLGYSLDSFSQLQIGDLVPALRGAVDAGLFSRVVESGREQVAKRADGVLLNVELSISPVDIKERLFFTLIIHDVTEQKKVEQLKSEFISTVSHELRTPLTSIKGALGVVLSGALGTLDEKVTQLLAIAATNTDRLSRLVNDILDIDKLEFGSLSLNLKSQSVYPLLQQAIEQHLTYAERYGVTLDLALPTEAESLIKVRLDADRFLQVMSNLISNAIKFSNPQSRVTVAMKRIGQNVQIEVIDKGQGIPASFHQRIFTRFAQVDSSTTRKRDGSGLGLSITKALVERMGGYIDYKSEIGQGTCFFISLAVVGED